MEQNIKKELRIKEDGVSRIVITSDADIAVNEIINRINDGFDAGRATKQEVVSRLIKRFLNECTDKDIQDMRMLFFNPLQLMEAMLKRAKETGELPDEVKDMLYKQYNSGSSMSKKNKKNLKDNAIIDSISNEGVSNESR